MHTTNYTNTLILVSPDCAVSVGTVPTKAETIAAIQYDILRARPYELTSDDLLVAVAAKRGNVREDGWEELRNAMFSKPQACLRASPLVKSFGWGLHHDTDGKVALVGPETAEYRQMVEDAAIRKTPGMRSRRP